MFLIVFIFNYFVAVFDLIDLLRCFHFLGFLKTTTILGYFDF